MRLLYLLLLMLLPAHVARAQAPGCPRTGPNRIVNGSFEQGYYGFTSDFGRGLNNATQGGCGTQGWILVTQTSPHTSPACQLYPAALSAQYGAPNTPTHPDPAHPSNTSVVTLATCNNPLPDHTTGTGFFLTIDPDDIPGRAYWKQTVYICPRTDYVFSVWVRNVEGGCGLPAPYFHFEVGGVPINMPTAYPQCVWVNTAVVWNSGLVEGLVEIELINDQPGCIANDVAIDDVFFGVCGGVDRTCAPYFSFCGEQADSPIRLSGRAEGFPFAWFQWQKFDPATGWENLPGAADSVLLLSAPTRADAGRYRLLAASDPDNARDPACAVASGEVLIEAFPEYAAEERATICRGRNVAGYTAPGVYVDTLASVHGCDSVRTLYLEVLGANPAFCYLPNVFSPNGDGVNDLFAPAFIPGISVRSYRMQVFDRWGNLLFDTDDPAGAWDGRFRGRDCAPDVYAYWLRVETEFCDATVYSGTVGVVR